MLWRYRRTDHPGLLWLLGAQWLALATRGEQGVVDLLAVIHREIEISMALMGVNRIDELTPELIER